MYPRQTQKIQKRVRSRRQKKFPQKANIKQPEDRVENQKAVKKEEKEKAAKNLSNLVEKF